MYLILIALAMLGQSFGQCPHDTLIDGGSPLGELQWSGQGDATISECPTCIEFDRSFSWMLLDTASSLTIHGNYAPPCDTVQIRLLNQCRFVHYDTCLALPLTGSGCEYRFGADMQSNSQVVVYWRSSGTDSVGVMGVSAQYGFQYPTAFLDLWQCSQTLGVAPEPETPQPIYFDLERLGVPVLQKNLQPNRRYKLINPK